MLFADDPLPWLGPVVASVLAVTTPIGGGIGWLLLHLAGQRKAQNEHQEKMADRYEAQLVAQRAHEASIMERVDKIAKDFETAAREMAKESREEGRKVTQTLLGIQRETVAAVGTLSQSVAELRNAITSLQGEMHRKADRPDAH